ncbi:MAG: leucine-rich repeat protein, partial [Thermoguttaceae bacterium]|nr:leucine-rich repeat protein [Thermoguttaceae bacterium]
CKALRNITIPDSVTEIGTRAFYDCTSLEKVSVSQAARWEEDTFENCPKLEIIRR